MGRFELKRSEDGQWHFVLKAKNGRVICQSETYKRKSGALNGIASVVENALDRLVVDENGDKFYI